MAVWHKPVQSTQTVKTNMLSQKIETIIPIGIIGLFFLQFFGMSAVWGIAFFLIVIFTLSLRLMNKRHAFSVVKLATRYEICGMWPFFDFKWDAFSQAIRLKNGAFLRLYKLSGVLAENESAAERLYLARAAWLRSLSLIPTKAEGTEVQFITAHFGAEPVKIYAVLTAPNESVLNRLSADFESYMQAYTPQLLSNPLEMYERLFLNKESYISDDKAILDRLVHIKFEEEKHEKHVVKSRLVRGDEKYSVAQVFLTETNTIPDDGLISELSAQPYDTIISQCIHVLTPQMSRKNITPSFFEKTARLFVSSKGNSTQSLQQSDTIIARRVAQGEALAYYGVTVLLQTPDEKTLAQACRNTENIFKKYQCQYETEPEAKLGYLTLLPMRTQSLNAYKMATVPYLTTDAAILFNLPSDNYPEREYVLFKNSN